MPAVSGPGSEVLDALGALVATSANLPAGPTHGALSDVPAELVAAAAAVVDGGLLAGPPSTVVDLTGAEPLDPPRGRAPGGRRARATRISYGSLTPGPTRA